jgi:SAM-dependent methyltransferase
MNDPARASQIAAATNYQDALVPALTGEWAPRVVEAAGIRRGNRVLDVACGTGVLSKAAAEAAGPTGSVTGLDVDAGMLAVAARVASGISWHRGVAEALPFPDATFEAVVSQFGLMFFPDRTRALREMWRVLKSGGRMAVAVWASLDDTPAYAAEVALVERLAGPAAAEVLRSPFVLGDRARFESTFATAGIPLESLTTVPGTGRFPSIRAMLDADLTGWLPVMGIHLERRLIERILAEAESTFRPYLTPDGTVQFASPAHIAVARRPRDVGGTR